MSEEKTEKVVENYEFSSPSGKVTIAFTEGDDLEFYIHGPKEVIAKAIGGLGEEDETHAWATEKNLDTEAKRLYAVLEVLKIAKEDNE